MPAPLHFAKSDAITSFSCGSTSYCALGLMTLAHVFSLYVSSDGGSSWKYGDHAEHLDDSDVVDVSTASLRRCGDTADSSELVRSTTFARTWKVAKLTQSASSVACTANARCVVVGQRASGQAWLSLVQGEVND